MFGAKLQQALELTGLTQAQLAAKTGLGQSHISQIARGQREPGVKNAAKLAEALGVSLDWLCDLPPRQVGELAPDEEEVLAAYRRAKGKGIDRVVLNTVRAMAGD